MTRLKVNGKRARRTGVVVASVAVLGMAVAPGIAWASNPISDGSPVAVRSIATAPSELGVAPEVACGVAAPISDEELQKLIDEGEGRARGGGRYGRSHYRSAERSCDIRCA